MKNNILTQIYFLTPKISIKTLLYAFQLTGGNAGKKPRGKFQSPHHKHQLNSLSRKVLCLTIPCNVSSTTSDFSCSNSTIFCVNAGVSE